MFHVETTAWEGEHTYEAPAEPKPEPEPSTATERTPNAEVKAVNASFASYGSYFWSKN